jgi:hypothetical protein
MKLLNSSSLMGGVGVLYIMAWVVCLLMGMGGLVEWEGCVQKWEVV